MATTTPMATAVGTTLAHANATIAQTWNRLSINDIALTVPAAPATPPAAPVSQSLAGIEMGGGEELTGWLDASARERRQERIAADGRQHTVVVTIDGVQATDVEVEPGAKARVVVIVPGADGGTTSGSALRIDAGAGSATELVEVVAAGADATFVESCGIRLADDARLEVRHFLLGSALCVVGLACELAGRRAAYEQATRYLAGDGQTVDMNYLARMRGGDTRARLGFSGVLEEGARKRLADTIDLIRGGKGAKGAEDETVLVNGEHVRNLSLPSVLCDEEDVEGTHGATIGSVSGEQLAYLTCRGLTEDEARELFVRSMFDDCLARVPEARAQILAAARDALGEEAAEEMAEGLAQGEDEAPEKEGMR